MKRCILITCALLVLLSFSVFSIDLKIQYRDGDYGNATDNHIKPHLKIVNNDPVSVALKDLTIRYYYSKEETSSETFHVDYAYIGGNNIIGTFYPDYVEIGFAPNAGDIPGGSDSGEIQIRINKDDWSDYNETNDYSYKNPALSYGEWDKISLYHNGILTCGHEPWGSTPAPQESTPLPSVSDPGNLPFVESGGMVVLEAENNTGNTPGTGWASHSFWKEMSSYNDSSNGMAVVAHPDKGVNVGDTTNGPGLNYDVTFTEIGTYYIWVRMWGPNSSSDSLHSGLDGIPASYGATGMSKTSNSWKWVNQAAGRVMVDVTTSGVHTINIMMREDGTRLDKILLTTDPGYVPTGQGPDESPRESTETPEPTIEPTPEPTLEPIPGIGNVRLYPENAIAILGENVELEVYVNTGYQLLGAYSFTLTYDATIVQIDTGQGNNGVDPGDDGFVAAVNALTPGTLICSGFDVSGTGPSTDLYLAVVNFTAVGAGSSPVNLTMDTLVDPMTDVIGVPGTCSSVINVQLAATQPPTVTDPPATTPVQTPAGATSSPASTPAPTSASAGIGDVNGDGLINIVDALLCAQYYIGLNASGFDASNADVNYDGEINIVDALLLAQYYVGIISELPGAEPTAEPDPTPVPAEGVGDMWIAPATLSVTTGGTFTTEIHLNSGTQNLAAYGIEIHYDSSKIIVDTATGNSGVVEGPDGITVVGVNSGTPGVLGISAFDPAGIGPSEDLNILAISWIALSGPSCIIEIVINDLVDADTVVIGIPDTEGAAITIAGPAVTVASTEEPTAVPTAASTTEPTPPPTIAPTIASDGVGEIWMVPASTAVLVGEVFTTEIHVNSGTQQVAAYGLDVRYNSSVLLYRDLEAGADGFLAVTNSNNLGIIIASGFDVFGTGPGEDLHLLTITWEAIAAGSSTLDIIVNTLANPETITIGNPVGIDGQVTVTAEGVSLKVQYQNGLPSDVADMFRPYFNIVNNGTIDIPLSELSIRYYYDRDGATEEQFYVDYAEVGTEYVLGTITEEYLEVTFSPEAGILEAQSETGQIIDSVWRQDGSLYDQSNDYSYDPNYLEYADYNRVTLHYDGEIIWGIDPANAPPSTPAPTETPAPTPTYIPTVTPSPTPDPTPRPTVVGGIPGEPGAVWIVPVNSVAAQGDDIAVQIYVNTGNQKLAAYQLVITFDSQIIKVNTSTWSNGVEPGWDGFVAAVNPNVPGQLTFNGFDVAGMGPSSELYLALVHFTALQQGVSVLGLSIDDLVDVNYIDIGIPTAYNGTITVSDEITPPPPTAVPTPAITTEPTPPPTLAPTVYYEGVGEVWIVPESITAFSGEEVTSEIHVNSGSQRVAAYGLEITYNPSILYYLDASEGADGYITAVNYHNAGNLIASGFDVNGTGPSEDLHLLTITWAASAPGTTVLSLHVSDLVDPGTKIIGNPMGIDAQVTVVVEGVSLKVQYQNGLISDVADMFRPYFNIVNTGTVDIPLSELSIRYYYDRDGAAEERFSVDYAEVGTEYVLGTITEEYLEVTFSPEAGILAAQSETGQIIDSVRRQDGILYDQTNDYSYDPNYPEYADYERVTLHYNGEIIWGIDPASAPPPTTVPTETPTPTPTNVPTETPTPTPDPTPRPTIDGGVPGGPGAVWFEPTDSITAPGGYISIKVYVNTGDQALAAYQFVITFDSSIVKVNTSVWNNGVIEGPDGFLTTVNPNVTGQLTFNGFDVSGKGPYPDLCLAIVYFTALQPGVTDLGLTIDDLVDLDYNDIGIPTAYDGTITVSDEIVPPEPTPDLTSDPTPDPTPEPTPTQNSTLDVGTMWIFPEQIMINRGTTFVTEIHCNSGNQILAAYGLEINYDYSVIEPNTVYGPGGIVEGADGFVAAANAATAGVTYVSGFDVSGKGPGADLHVLDAHWNALNSGTTEITLSIDTLVDVNTENIGNPRGVGGTVIIQ